MADRHKKKRTAAQKRAHAEWKRTHAMVFLNGQQKWIKKPPTVDGLAVDEFVRRNADPLWLHQNEMWELMPEQDMASTPDTDDVTDATADDDEIPF